MNKKHYLLPGFIFVESIGLSTDDRSCIVILLYWQDDDDDESAELVDDECRS